MKRQNFPVVVTCVACQQSMGGTLNEAMRWDRCSQCGDPRLVFAADTPPTFRIPAKRGSLLSDWQAMHVARSAPAAATGRPPGPPKVRRPQPMAARTNHAPAQRKPSKSLIITRLVVACIALMVAGVVTVAWIMTKGNASHQQVSDAEETQVEAQGIERPPQPATVNRATDRQKSQAVQSFRSGASGRAAGLRETAGLLGASIEDPYTKLKAELLQRRNEAEAEVASLTTDERDVSRSLDESSRSYGELKARHRELEQSQSAAAKFVASYRRMGELRKETQQAAVNWRKDMAAADEAAKEVDRLAEMLAGTESAGERTLLKGELNEATEALEEANAREKEAHREVRRLSDELAATEVEVVEARSDLSTEQPDEGRLIAAFESYTETLKAIREQNEKIEAYDVKVESLNADLSSAEDDSAEKREAYKSAENELRELGSQASRAKRAYERHGGAARKQRAEDLFKQRSEAALRASSARIAYNESTDKVGEIQSDIDECMREIDKVRDRIEEIEAEGQSLKDEIDRVVEDVARQVLPEEDRRLALVEECERELDAVQGEVNELTARRDSIRDEKREIAAEVDRVSAELDELRVSYESSVELLGECERRLNAVADRLEGIAGEAFVGRTDVSSLVRECRAAEESVRNASTVTGRFERAASEPVSDASRQIEVIVKSAEEVEYALGGR